MLNNKTAKLAHFQMAIRKTYDFSIPKLFEEKLRVIFSALG